jgi:hypothetical protein
MYKFSFLFLQTHVKISGLSILFTKQRAAVIHKCSTFCASPFTNIFFPYSLIHKCDTLLYFIFPRKHSCQLGYKTQNKRYLIMTRDYFFFFFSLALFSSLFFLFVPLPPLVISSRQEAMSLTASSHSLSEHS